jgi:predicted dehydrogenase
MIAPALAAHGLMRVAAVASRNPKGAEGIAEALGGADICSNFKEVMDRDDIEAVYIAAPPHLHREMMIYALHAGKHVICEKPFAMSIAHQRREDLKVGSCSSRFLVCPAARTAREMLSSGKIGGLLRVRFNVAMPPPLPI